MVNKRVWNAVLGCNLKNDRMNSVRFQGKPFNITVIQVYAQTSNAEEAEVERFYEDLQDLRTNTQKRCPFHYRELECKSRESRNTWSNRQIWLWSTEWSRAKANRVLPREHTGHSKHPLPTTQEKTLPMDITRWSTPKSDWLYSLQPEMEKLYTVNKTGPGADCGSDHELLIAKFTLKLKKVGKSTRPIRYDLNQIPYDYTVEVRNSFKGLDLIDKVPDELWTEVCDIVNDLVLCKSDFLYCEFIYAAFRIEGKIYCSLA